MLTRRLFKRFSQSARRKRAAILHRMLKPDPSWSILDLGGAWGRHIELVFPEYKNITVADFTPEHLREARELRGYKTVQIDASERLPFRDKEFDLVFCSSVIEHVTHPKDVPFETRDGRKFRETAFHHQRILANEIRRIGKRYFVQTPHRYYMIESHSWLPMPIVLLPRPAQVKALELAERFWVKRTDADWNLLVPSEMQALFPEAEIVVESTFGWPKSIMAVGRQEPSSGRRVTADVRRRAVSSPEEVRSDA